MDYMKKVEELIERIPETNDRDIITNFLKNEYEQIKEISDHVKQVPMYKDNLKRVKEYLEETKDHSLIDRWLTFLIKSTSAPFSLMLQGVVIFHMPILEEEIRKCI